jgi:hypothetical protein
MLLAAFLGVVIVGPGFLLAALTGWGWLAIIVPLASIFVLVSAVTWQPEPQWIKRIDSYF